MQSENHEISKCKSFSSIHELGKTLNPSNTHLIMCQMK